VTPNTPWTETREWYAGAEPLPGYRLIAPLGRGGFGEVWKCEVPGGLHKAIKFVAAGGDECRRELAAFEQIKALRHPYLLTLERVELTDGELMMVMELADCQLHDRFLQCRNSGLPGIPREELLGYMKEAAEALDTIGTKHGLQHLDVKPQNLFLVSGHAKVGDYGLLRRTEQVGTSDDSERGFTPRYTAPELFHHGATSRSDQYSLALVYVELLTGSFPYTGKTVQQLMLQHINVAPNLSMVPACDRPALARAMAKSPDDRFPTCLAFARALGGGSTDTAPNENQQAQDAASLVQTPVGYPGSMPQYPSADPTPVTRRTTPRPLGRVARMRQEAAPPPDPFARFKPVMPVNLLHESCALAARAPTQPTSMDYINAVVEAGVKSVTAAHPGESVPEGAHTCRLLSTLPTALVPLKLVVVAEEWNLSAQVVDEKQLILSRQTESNLRKSGKNETTPEEPTQWDGFEIFIRIPTPPAVEYTIFGKICGSPGEEFTRKAQKDIPAILSQIRSLLHNFEERRAHPRYEVDFPIKVFPLYTDGVVGTPLSGRCLDLSLGGLRFVTPTPVRTERMFIEFPEVAAVAGHAIYMRVVRIATDATGAITVARFRTRA
jgi:serine/threonine protein kinase